MWQHEIVENFQYISWGKGESRFDKEKLDRFLNNLLTSPCFFFGKFEETPAQQLFDISKGQTVNLLESGLPFDMFTLEYKNIHDEPQLVFVCFDENGLGLKMTRYTCHNGRWSSPMFFWGISIGDKHGGESFVYDAIPTTYSIQAIGEIAKWGKDNPDKMDVIHLWNIRTTGEVYSLLQFLNCRNIYTENVIPDAKLNRKRQKKGKPPMVEYKILKVNKGVPKVKYTDVTHPWGQIPADCVTAQHLCRGHFKEYTEDSPLFGKYSGRFWWGPQVRGSVEKGIIVKDYEVV